MTVEPGFGGQAFMGDVLAAKADGARELLSHKLYGGEIHVDGGINRETVEVAGAHGVDVFVVGSALFLKGRDMGRELRLIRALADEGFQYGRNEGRPPIPHDRMSIIASMPKAFARQFVAEVEATGIPVVMLRGDGQINPDGVRDYDLLVPAIRRGAHRAAPWRDAQAPPARRRRLAGQLRPQDVRALLQRVTEASVTVDGTRIAEIGPGPAHPARRGAGR